MALKSDWINVKTLPQVDEVENVLKLRDYNNEAISAKLTRALLMIQDWELKLDARQEFVEEYNKVLELLLTQNGEQQDELRSYKSFENYILSTIEKYPNENVFEFEINGGAFCNSVYMKYDTDNDVLMFSTKLRFTKRLEKLFEETIPKHIQRDLQQMPRDATEIWVTAMYTVIPEWWSFGMEIVFDVTYSGTNGVDWDLEITHTFHNEQDGYSFLVRNTDEENTFEKILIYCDSYLYKSEMDRVLEDTDILEKLEMYNKDLFLIVSAYIDSSLDADAYEKILSDINNNPDWKWTLRTHSTEWSIWRLRYLLENPQNNYFYLWLRDTTWGVPASMMSFPAFTQEMKQVVEKISYITGWKILEKFSWRKRINLSISWELIGNGNVKLNVVIDWKKWKQQVNYVYKKVIVAEQLLELICLVTPTNFPLASVICREEIDHDDYDDA